MKRLRIFMMLIFCLESILAQNQLTNFTELSYCVVRDMAYDKNGNLYVICNNHNWRNATLMGQPIVDCELPENWSSMSDNFVVARINKDGLLNWHKAISSGDITSPWWAGSWTNDVPSSIYSTPIIVIGDTCIAFMCPYRLAQGNNCLYYLDSIMGDPNIHTDSNAIVAHKIDNNYHCVYPFGGALVKNVDLTNGIIFLDAKGNLKEHYRLTMAELNSNNFIFAQDGSLLDPNNIGSDSVEMFMEGITTNIYGFCVDSKGCIYLTISNLGRRHPTATKKRIFLGESFYSYVDIDISKVIPDKNCTILKFAPHFYSLIWQRNIADSIFITILILLLH